MILDIKTAPSESVYEELDLVDVAEPEMLSPVSMDVELQLYDGDINLIERAMQSRIRLKLIGATSAQIEQFEKWQHERTFLRLNGNYGERTIFYNSFQRPRIFTGEIGAQIGTNPTLDRDFTTVQGDATYIGDDGKFHIVPDDYPRYQESCYGMKGLLVESASENLMVRTHPQSGNLLWTLHTGTPTINWSTYFESPVVDPSMTDGTAVISMAVGDLVYHLSNTTSTTGDHSYFVYVRGWGQIRVRAYKNGSTHVVSSNGVNLDPEEWTRIELRAIALTSSDYVQMRIECLSATAYFFVANDQLEPLPYHTSYMHNITANGKCIKEMDEVALTNLKNLSGGGTFIMGLKHPGFLTPFPSTSHWFLGDANETFKLQYQINLFTQYFQKKSAGLNANYISAITPGTEMIIAGSYNKDWITIYENGVEKDESAYGGVAHSIGTTLYMGAYIQRLGPNAPIAFLRIDDKRMTDAEVLKAAQLYTDADIRLWTNRCEGRDYIIDKMSTPLRVGPGTHDSTVVLKEMQAEETATLRTR